MATDLRNIKALEKSWIAPLLQFKDYRGLNFHFYDHRDVVNTSVSDRFIYMVLAHLAESPTNTGLKEFAANASADFHAGQLFGMEDKNGPVLDKTADTRIVAGRKRKLQEALEESLPEGWTWANNCAYFRKKAPCPILANGVSEADYRECKKGLPCPKKHKQPLPTPRRTPPPSKVNEVLLRQVMVNDRGSLFPKMNMARAWDEEKGKWKIGFRTV